MRMIRMLGLLAVLVALALPAGSCGSSSSPPSTHLVTLLLAAPGSPFTIGTRYEIEVTLRNDGTIPTNVTSRVHDALRITASSEDGQATVRSLRNIDTEEDLKEALADSLVTLAPGASMTFTLRTWGEASVGGQALALVRPGTPDQEEMLDLSAAATFEITMVYDYEGTVPAGTTVFTDPTAPATVMFVAQP